MTTASDADVRALLAEIRDDLQGALQSEALPRGFANRFENQLFARMNSLPPEEREVEHQLYMEAFDAFFDRQVEALKQRKHNLKRRAERVLITTKQPESPSTTPPLLE